MESTNLKKSDQFLTQVNLIFIFFILITIYFNKNTLLLSKMNIER